MGINSANLEIAGESNAGLIRHHNEDNFLICAPPGGKAVLAAVADGIGGHSRGEIASFICCRELLLAARKVDSAKWDGNFLCDALQRANSRIFNFNYQGRRPKPMGCTVAAAIFTREKMIFTSAGDSRIYEFFRAPGRKALKQLTVDHRPEGYEELEQELAVRFTSMISRSVGTSKHLPMEIEELPRMPGAKYLLCSDGLYNRQPDQVLAGILGSEYSARKSVDLLLRGALLAGERDNISVICAADTNSKGVDHGSA